MHVDTMTHPRFVNRSHGGDSLQPAHSASRAEALIRLCCPPDPDSRPSPPRKARKAAVKDPVTPRATFHPTFRPRAPQVSSNSPSLYLTPPAPTVVPSAHLCSPVTRAHRSVLAPLDARALLHHYPMPLEPAFSPLARPAPPPCLPSLYRARCLLLRCTACNSKQSLRPEGVRISPGCWRGGAARSGPRPTGCWVLPDPHPCASSPSSLNPFSLYTGRNVQFFDCTRFLATV